MGYDAAVDRIIRAYCQTVLDNAAHNIHRDDENAQKALVPLDSVLELPDYQKYFIYNERFDSVSGYYHTINVFGETFGFTDEILVRALYCLPEEQRQIVLLYYGLEKSDETIRKIMGIKNRSTVQYHRQVAMGRLKRIMAEEDNDHDF